MINVRTWNVAFVSSPILIEPKLMATSWDHLAFLKVAQPFLFATSLHLENSNSLIMGIGVNDNSAIIVRLTEFKSMLLHAIETDMTSTSSGDSRELERGLILENWLREKIRHQMAVNLELWNSVIV